MAKDYDLEWFIQKLSDEIKYGERTGYGVWMNGFLSKTFLNTMDDIIKKYNLEIER